MTCSTLLNKYSGDLAGYSYHLYSDREEWFEERKRTVGASELSSFILTGKVPSPLPTDDEWLIKICDFGNDWEPFVFNVFMKRLGYKSMAPSVPVHMLEPGTGSLHENSFYEIAGIVHASLDGCLRETDLFKRNETAIVEVKTGKAQDIKSLRKDKFKKYMAQSFIEKMVSGADNMILIYANRPDGFAEASEEEISRHLEDTFDFMVLGDDVLSDVKIPESLGGKLLKDVTLDDLVEIAKAYKAEQEKGGSPANDGKAKSRED